VRIGQRGPAPGSRAAFTIVKDEPRFLPIWLDHYGRSFAPEDLYVLDHQSIDGSLDAARGRCHVLPVEHPTTYHHTWLVLLAERFQSFLLASYETVLYTDADELVLAEPRRFRDLGEYIDAMDGPVARCTGFEVVQQVGEEPLRFGEPLLAQRRWWYRVPLYDKPLLACLPLAWTPGFHTELRFPDVQPDPDLYLLHMHRADRDYCLERHRAAAARDWNDEDLAIGRGYQNRIVEPDEFERWFYGEGLGGAEREEIPERLRGLA
jgi:hypothetical protein